MAKKDKQVKTFLTPTLWLLSNEYAFVYLQGNEKNKPYFSLQENNLFLPTEKVDFKFRKVNVKRYLLNVPSLSSLEWYVRPANFR